MGTKGAPAIETLTLDPYFDLELFMLLSQNKRLDTATAELAEECWRRWHDRMQGRRIGNQGQGYLLLWLEESVEREVNSTWDEAPSRAFTMNSVAQSMLMAVVREYLPEVGGSGCAPVPKPTPALKKALKEIGVPWNDNATLARQYAMLTPFPFKGSCGICYLKEECPNSERGKG